MKKILFLLAIVAATSASYESQAQVKFTGTTSNPLDSLIDTGSDTLKYSLTKGYSSISIQPKATVGSGSLGSAKHYLYYSTFSASGPWILNDSLTASTVATTPAAWNKTIPARYWRIITTGATTVRAKIEARLQTN